MTVKAFLRLSSSGMFVWNFSKYSLVLDPWKLINQRETLGKLFSPSLNDKIAVANVEKSMMNAMTHVEKVETSCTSDFVAFHFNSKLYFLPARFQRSQIGKDIYTWIRTLSRYAFSYFPLSLFLSDDFPFERFANYALDGYNATYIPGAHNCVQASCVCIQDIPGWIVNNVNFRSSSAFTFHSRRLSRVW